MSETPPGAEVPSDAELITMVRAGVTDGYGELYRRHVGSATAFARQLASAASEVDDLVAEAFTKVLDALRAGKGPELAFRSYLLTTLRNIAYERHRRAKPVTLSDDLGEVPDQVETQASVFEDIERSLAAKAFQRLPERWQAVLWYTEIEGHNPAEVAPCSASTPTASPHWPTAPARACARHTCRSTWPTRTTAAAAPRSSGWARGPGAGCPSARRRRWRRTWTPASSAGHWRRNWWTSTARCERRRDRWCWESGRPGTWRPRRATADSAVRLARRVRAAARLARAERAVLATTESRAAGVLAVRAAVLAVARAVPAARWASPSPRWWRSRPGWAR